jgi:DNA-binding NarL/FixJ family response regulator
MLAALRTLREGGASVSPLIARKILERLRFNPPLPESIKRPDIVGDTVLEIAGLTQREIEILQILARGHSFNEIGAQMFISAHTVARHVKSIYRKLTVHSRGEAVYAAARMGLL